MIEADDVEAMLELGPTSTSSLARAFRVSLLAMTRRLGEISRAGRVRRQSTSGRWFLVQTPVAGEMASLDAVADQIAFEPKASTQIARVLEVSNVAVERALFQLQADGRAKLIGRGSGARWASAAWSLRDGIRSAPRSPHKPAAASVPRVNMARANGIGNDAIFAKPAAPVTVDASGLSWWVAPARPGAPRGEFYQAAARRDEAGQQDRDWRKGSKVIEVGAGRADV